jgi:predicted DNA-binding helix-hairpin-helix protein
MAGGMLDLAIDPKLAWALQNRDRFPVDVNRGSKEELLRVPGLGTKAVSRILASRRTGRLRLDDVARLTGSIARARPFLTALDWHPGATLDDAHLRGRLALKPVQLPLL